MPRLDFYTDYRLFVKLKLGETSVLVGRGADCDVQLPDEPASPGHQRARCVHDQAVVEGGDRRLRAQRRLQAGDQRRILSMIFMGLAGLGG